MLTSFLYRAGVRHAWSICKPHFDTTFQGFVDARLLMLLEEAGTDPAIIYAFQKTGLLVEDANEHRFGERELNTWKAALDEYKRRKAG